MSRTMKFILSFAIFILACFVGLKWFVQHEVEKEFNKAVANTPGLVVNYDGISVDISDHCVVLTKLKAMLPTGHTLSADEIRITDFDQFHTIPHSISASARNLAFPATPENFGDMAATMNAFGITTIMGDALLDYVYDPVAKTLTIKGASIDDPKLGYARITGRLDSIDIETLRPEQVIAIKIGEAELTFTNHSLMGIVAERWAESAGMSEAATINRISDELDMLAELAGRQENTAAENVMLGLKRFLNDPGTAVVSIEPNEPVPFLYFFMGRDTFDILRLLNMSITTDSSEGI